MTFAICSAISPSGFMLRKSSSAGARVNRGMVSAGGAIAGFGAGCTSGFLMAGSGNWAEGGGSAATVRLLSGRRGFASAEAEDSAESSGILWLQVCPERRWTCAVRHDQHSRLQPRSRQTRSCPEQKIAEATANFTKLLELAPHAKRPHISPRLRTRN